MTISAPLSEMLSLSLTSPVVVCIQQTKLASLDGLKARSFLPAGLSDFATVDAMGSRGGIATAWDPRFLSMSSSTRLAHSLTTVFVSTSIAMSFTITNVYAPSDHSHTACFVSEMDELAPTVQGAWLIIGDFNLIRYSHEKNNSNFDLALSAMFNAMIQSLAWFEFPLLDRRFTWTNGQENPVLARLDRAFFNNN
jgi:hypothetical protein